METITGRDGQQYPISTKEDLRKSLELSARNAEAWNNYGVSSTCKYAIERIRELEAIEALLPVIKQGLKAGLTLGGECRLNPTAYVRQINDAIDAISSLQNTTDSKDEK